MPKKFIIKDEDGKQFEITETSEEVKDKELPEAKEVKDEELFTSDEIAALKELAKRSVDLLALLSIEKTDGCDEEADIVDENKDEEVIETKSNDSKKSVGSTEKKKVNDSKSDFDSEIEIADAWSKRFNSELSKKSKF